MPNRLAQESSPYLLQHKDNPVDWFPWGEEALARARGENRPILLSIGYSACHWCHVMEHESFENPDIARLMNESYVCIKVDREERPDLDQIYQNVAQAMTRGGGWPLTVFLTPDLRPFYGGTYFPPEDRWGRPGFPRLLEALAKAYRESPGDVAENAQKLTDYIRSLESVPRAAPRKPSLDELKGLGAELLSMVDPAHGGFGGAPKFPNAMSFAFLWRLGLAGRDIQMQESVLLTLTKMAEGGIYDQLGGGFARYSVDETWSVPHFEKMLYDNALLLRLYAEALLGEEASPLELDRDLYVRVLRETVSYLLREMRSPEGAFYAAQDADSEGEEGKFFAWSPEDLERLTQLGGLGRDEARALALRYGISPEGNFEHGKTVLFLARTVAEIAAELRISELDARLVLASGRKKLFDARSRRVPPGTDNKILASWNGLVISGLAWASQALARSGEIEAAAEAHAAARAAFTFVLEQMSSGEGRLYSTFQGGIPKLNAYLDDYAFMARGALDLARFAADDTEAAECLACAEAWVGRVLKHFGDPGGAGYFFTSDDHERLIQRPKTVFDQAIPSGTAVTLEALAALSVTSARGAEWARELERQLGALAPLAERAPMGCGELLCVALLDAMGPITVAGPEAARAIRHSHAYRKPADAGAEEQLLVCHRQSCSLPLSDAEAAWKVEILPKAASLQRQ